MSKQTVWWLVAIVIGVGVWWWLAQGNSLSPKSEQQTTTDSQTNSQSSQPTTNSEAAVSGDLKAADQDANSIDFSNDFSSTDLDDLAK